MNYKVGTRGSRLALVQTDIVINKLKKANPSDNFEKIIFKTSGDKDQKRDLELIGEKGVFADTIEAALQEGQIDFAVHSMKDMPSKSLEGLTFAKAWEREDARDVLILRDNFKSLDDLPHGAVIGTCSKRRDFQLRQIRNDLKTTLIRGNIDTRIKKLHDGYSNGVKIDGIIIAAAGIKRLGRSDEITKYFTVDEIIPSPAQGTLCIELRKDNADLLGKCNTLYDPNNDIVTSIEREFLLKIGATCHEPIGAYAEIYDGKIMFRAIYGSPDGSKLAKVKIVDDKDKIVDRAIKEITEKLK